MSKKNKRKKQKQNVQSDKAGAFEFIQKINFILQKVRESDSGMMETKNVKGITDDPNKLAITKVLFPEEGGVYTYFDGLEHPAKGFCYGETVETVDEVKKTIMALLTGFFDAMSKGKLRTLIFAFLFKKQFVAIGKRLVIQIDYRMRRVRQKPDKYCTCAREIYRVFNLMETWYPEYVKEIKSIKNIICMALEYDDAYRYTLQDTLPELDKDAVKKNTVKEIKRILDLVLERDNRGLCVKLLKIRKLLFLLNYSKGVRTILERFLCELDLDKIKLDEADSFHAHYKESYNWDHVKNYKQKEEEKRKSKEAEEKEIQK